MYQVNYNGLRKRESYEEIVAILEHDTTKLQYTYRVHPGKKRRYPYIPDAFNARLKYPDRTATHILNSPYMKQLDGETMLEMQKQQDRLSKENLKEIMIQSLADASGLPKQHLKSIKPQNQNGKN